MSMTTKLVPTWEQFVTENLLQSGLFDGLCLISNQQELVYVYGALTNLNKGDIDQFFKSFTSRELDGSSSFLNVHINDSTSRVTFRVYYRTCVSVYATTSGSHSSLTVSKLGHGVFVALFSKPVIAHKAIALVEEFTNKLRY